MALITDAFRETELWQRLQSVLSPPEADLVRMIVLNGAAAEPTLLGAIEAAIGVALGAQASDIIARAQVLRLPEFLAPQELDRLTHFALSRERDFGVSQVISADSNEGITDYGHRRSRVLFELGEHQAVLTERILDFLPFILRRLQIEPFDVDRIEVQLTASNDGEFFRNHNDNAHDALRGRLVTFVYFFHREPKAFAGGELCLYDTLRSDERAESLSSGRMVVPQQNEIVFFASGLMHEVRRVVCPSQRFEDSRFTLNGWIRCS